MTERELRAVMQAYHDADEAGCTLEQCWEAAISASDSRFVKGLVEALKEITKEENTIRPAIPAWGIAVRALRNLPEDLRK